MSGKARVQFIAPEPGNERTVGPEAYDLEEPADDSPVVDRYLMVILEPSRVDHL